MGLDPAWIVALISLSTAVVGLIAWALRWAWRAARRIGRFLDDYFGEPEHDGLPLRPGVMARMASLEASQAKILAEVQPNTGHSLRDVVNRTDDTVSQVKKDVADLSRRVDQMSGGQR